MGDSPGRRNIHRPARRRRQMRREPPALSRQIRRRAALSYSTGAQKNTLNRASRALRPVDGYGTSLRRRPVGQARRHLCLYGSLALTNSVYYTNQLPAGFSYLKFHANPDESCTSSRRGHSNRRKDGHELHGFLRITQHTQISHPMVQITCRSACRQLSSRPAATIELAREQNRP